MTGHTLLDVFIVAVLITIAFVGWALCRGAAMADRDMERHWLEIEGNE